MYPSQPSVSVVWHVMFYLALKVCALCHGWRCERARLPRASSSTRPLKASQQSRRAFSLEVLGTGVGFGLCDFAVVGTLFAIIRTAGILLAQAASAVSVWNAPTPFVAPLAQGSPIRRLH